MKGGDSPFGKSPPYASYAAGTLCLGSRSRSVRTSLLLDSGLLAGELAQIIQLGATHLTDLVHCDAVDVRRLNRENSLNTYSAGHLANGETLLVAVSADLDDNAAIRLHALFVTLDNAVCHGHCVTGLELRAGLACGERFFCDFN